EIRGLNYGDYAYLEAFPEGGERQMPPVNVPRRHQVFEVWLRTLPNAHAHFALRAAVRELDRLVRDGLRREDFELTRAFLAEYVLHFAETTARRLGYAMDDRFYGLEGEGHLERFRRMMLTVTHDDVNDAIARHLRDRSLKIAIVTGDAARLRDALASGAPSPIEYPSAKADEVREGDRESERYPLPIETDAIAVLPVGQVFERCARRAARLPASVTGARGRETAGCGPCGDRCPSACRRTPRRRARRRAPRGASTAASRHSGCGTDRANRSR